MELLIFQKSKQRLIDTFFGDIEALLKDIEIAKVDKKSIKEVSEIFFKTIDEMGYILTSEELFDTSIFIFYIEDLLFKNEPNPEILIKEIIAKRTNLRQK
jgi:hypothetical protein